MDIKQFAYRMQETTGVSRSQCYEIIAAYLGYGSYAAYKNSSHPPLEPGFDKAKARCEAFGLDGSPAVWVRENVGSAQ